MSLTSRAKFSYRSPLTALVAMIVAAAGVAAGPGAQAANPHPDMSARVVGGTIANRAATPFFLQMALVGPPNSGTLCGATAINQRWAVTAAHCVAGAGGRAYIGKGQTALLVNPPARNVGTRYYIQRVVVHPNWRANSPTQWWDIALVQTMKPMPTPGLVPNAAIRQPVLNTPETVYGFGERITDVPSSIPGRLHQGNVTDLAGTTGTCGDYGQIFNPALQICAGRTGGGIDACYGDSGGPLVANVAGRIRLVGIVSAGIDCATSAYPGLYTRVSRYMPWIQFWTSGAVATSVSCPADRCTLSRNGRVIVRMTNIGVRQASWRINGQRGLLRISPVAGQLKYGQGLRAVVIVNARAPRCIPVTIRATASPIRRIMIAANGKTGCW